MNHITVEDYTRNNEEEATRGQKPAKNMRGPNAEGIRKWKKHPRKKRGPPEENRVEDLEGRKMSWSCAAEEEERQDPHLEENKQKQSEGALYQKDQGPPHRALRSGKKEIGEVEWGMG